MKLTFVPPADTDGFILIQILSSMCLDRLPVAIRHHCPVLKDCSKSSCRFNALTTFMQILMLYGAIFADIDYFFILSHDWLR